MTQPEPVPFDPFGERFGADPYAVFGELRETAPVQLVRLPTGLECWLVTRYDEARAALADHRRLSNDPRYALEPLRRAGIVVGEGGTGLTTASLLTSDAPEHTRMRRLLGQALTPERVEHLRPHVRATVDRLLDAMAPAGPVDLMEQLAYPLTITTICDLLGVEAGRRRDFRGWVAALMTPTHVPEARRIRREGDQALRGYLAALVAAKRLDAAAGHPGDDLTSALVAARDEGDRLTEAELANVMLELLLGGYETTAGLIGSGILALLGDPDQARLLVERPELLPQAVEEFLRYDGPATRASLRFSVEDVELGGVTIPAGSCVSVAFGSAGRDPRKFPHADRLDVCRADGPHLCFSHGPHLCPGASVARIETAVAIGTLFARFPDVRLACEPDEIVWRTVGNARALRALPVRLTAP